MNKVLYGFLFSLSLDAMPQSLGNLSPMHKEARKKADDFLKKYNQRMDTYYAQLKSSNTFISNDGKAKATVEEESPLKKIAMQTYVTTLREHFKEQESMVNDERFIASQANKVAQEYLKQKKVQEESCCASSCVIS